MKRNNNEFHVHSIQARRLTDGKGYSSVFNKLQPPSFTSHVRSRSPSRLKPVHVPPYAVKMEPLVQYSQRDPLYHDKEVSYNVTSADLEKHSKADTFAEAASNFIDHVPPPRYGPPHGFDISHNFPHHFYKEPEPIIEIIIKESNESLPTPPPPPSTTTHAATKEPIQVFYVKYKKNPSYAGKDEVIYEEPIPALTPLSTDIVENNAVTEAYYPSNSYPSPSPPSTTYRTIIRPDSEVYHGNGLKVTFGNHEESSHLTHRSVEAQKRDSVVDQNETAQTLDYKSVIPVDRPLQLAQQLLEQRQNQLAQAINDYSRFAGAKPATDPPAPSNLPSPVLQPNIQQPLQFEDGSYEKPPPLPPLGPQSSPPKFVFPAPYTNNIPFRPQHTFNFPQPSIDQNNPSVPATPVDFGNQQIDPNLLQRPSQFTLNNFQNNKQFQRVPQQLVPQFQILPNQQQQPQHFSNIDPTFGSQLNNAKPQSLTDTSSNRFAIRPNNYNTADVKANRGVQQPQQPIEAQQHVSYNPQLHLQQANYLRNEFLQQPFSSQKQQQALLLQQQLQQQQLQQQQLQQQQQQLQQQQQQLNERQKQLQYEKLWQQQSLLSQKAALQRRPTDLSEYASKSPENKTRLSLPQNYRDALTNIQRSAAKAQRTSKTETQTVPAIKDGQIYKSISQSEEHQVSFCMYLF